MRKEGKGFTLAEVMTVLAIVSLLTAIAIPNLLRAKTNANEAAAIKTLEAIGVALYDYSIVQTPPSFPSLLNDLATENPPYLAQEITDSSWTAVNITNLPDPPLGLIVLPGYKGYTFLYRPRPMSNIYDDYSLFALPKTEGSSGVRYFAIDTSGMVRETGYDDIFTGSGGGKGP